MFSIKGTTITLTRGDTLMLQLALTKNGEPYIPEEGDTIRFALKKSIPNVPKSKSGEPLLTKQIPTNTLLLVLDPEDTEELLYGNYIYDLQMTFADGAVDTFVANANFTIDYEVD